MRCFLPAQRARSPYRALLFVSLTAIAALSAAGCFWGGGDDDDEPTPTVGATNTAAPASTATRPAQQPSATPTETATPTSTLEAAGEATAAIEAATDITGGRHLSPLTAAGCQANNPSMEPCVELTSVEGTVEGGIAIFKGGYPDAGPFQMALGQATDGTWGLWWATQQQTYTLRELPGTALACPTQGPLTVYAEPSESAAAVTEVERFAELSVDGFVLTEPGSFQDGARGHGWYRITAPAEGWVAASAATDAALGDCNLRDAIENAGSHG